MTLHHHSRIHALIHERGGFVEAPNHRLVSGAKVSFHGLRGASHLNEAVFTVSCDVRGCNANRFCVFKERVVGIQDVDSNAGTIRTSEPHGLQQRTTFVTLAGFRDESDKLNGTCFKASAVNEDILALSLCTFCTRWHDGALAHILRLPVRLRGGESFSFDDRVVIDTGTTAGPQAEFRTVPTPLSLRDVQDAWRASLDKRASFDRLVGCETLDRNGHATPNIPNSSLKVMMDGSMSSYGGIFERRSGPGATALFTRGCLQLTFDPWLRRWAITADLRPCPHSRLHSLRHCAGEKDCLWEGPQLLYICADASPLGRWLPVVGPQGTAAPIVLTVEEALVPLIPNLSQCITLKGATTFPLRVPSILAVVLSMLFDHRAVDWRGYIDEGWVYDIGPPVGPTGPELAIRLVEALRLATSCLSVDSLWHSATSVWISSWRTGFCAALQTCTKTPISNKVLALLACTSTGDHRHVMQVTRHPTFRRMKWGAAVESVDLFVCREPGGPQHQHACLVALSPAFLIFAQAVWGEEDLSWSHRTICYGCVDSQGDDSSFYRLQHRSDELHERYKGRATVLFDGAHSFLVMRNGMSLSERLQTLSSTVLHRELLRTLGPASTFTLLGCRQTLGSRGRKAGRRQCWRHSCEGEEIDSYCEYCQEERGFAVLQVKVVIDFLVEAPELRGARKVVMTVTASLPSFLTTSEDSVPERKRKLHHIGSELGAMKRRRLRGKQPNLQQLTFGDRDGDVDGPGEDEWDVPIIERV